MLKRIAIALAIAAALCVGGLAIAQTSDPSTQTVSVTAPTPATQTPWQPLLASALGLLALAVRRFQLLRWLPDGIEEAATIALLAAIGSTIPAFEAGTFVWPTSLYTALAAAMTAAAALWMPAPKDPPNGAGTVSRALLALVLCGSLFASGCACSRPADPKYNSAQCIFARDTVDCLKTVGEAEWQNAVAIALALIAGGVVDVPTLLLDLEHAGVTFGECVLAAIAKDFVGGTRANVNAQNFVAGWNAWTTAARPGVRYLLP